MKKLLNVLLILWMLLPAAAMVVCDCNPIASGIKFEQPEIVINLDKEWTFPENSQMREALDVAVQDINEYLLSTQLVINQTDELLSLNDIAKPCNSLPFPENFECIEEKRQEQRVTYANSMILTFASNTGSLRRYCDDGSDIDPNNPCQDTILFGSAAVRSQNIQTYGFDTAVDVLRHEIMHALGLPHVYGPYQVQGTFDFQATAVPLQGYNWKKLRIPNMDPIIDIRSNGLKRTDIQNLQDKYGKPDNVRTLRVNLVQDNGETVTGMNVALWHRKRKLLRSTARSSYDGVAILTTLKGRYYILVRPVPVARGANASSGVEGERTPHFTPTSDNTKFVCSRKRGVYRLCSNPKKKKAVKLKKDREITILID